MKIQSTVSFSTNKFLGKYVLPIKKIANYGVK